MADDTLDYKVNVDTSSLAAQLQQIKNQVDSAMAAYTFNATLPDPSQRLFTSSPGQRMDYDLQQFGSTVDRGMGMAQTQAIEFMNATRFGFQKLTADIHSMSPSFNTGIARTGLAATAGLGYDPNSGMTLGRYKERAGERLSDMTPELLQQGLELGAATLFTGGVSAGIAGSLLGGTAAGSALGAGGIAMAGAGIALGIPALAGGAFMSTFGYDVGATFKGRAFARDTSWKFASGKFNNFESTQIGAMMSTLGRSNENIGYGVSQNEAMGMVEDFTAMGGFDSVRTATEFRDRAKGLASQLKQIMEITGGAGKEIMTMMKNLMDSGVLPSNLAGASTQFTSMAGMAYRAGYQYDAFAAFGVQAGEVARGTGMNMGDLTLGGMRALASVKEDIKLGIVTPGMLQNVGGAENLAALELGHGLKFLNSEAGLVNMLAGAGGIGMNIGDRYARGVMRIGSLHDYTSARGQQARAAGRLGGDLGFLMQSNEFGQLAQGIGMIDTEDAFIGFALDQGYDQVTSQAMYRKLGAAREQSYARAAGGLLDQNTRLAAENKGAQWTALKDEIARGSSQALNTTGVAQFFTGIGNSLDRGTTWWGNAWDSGAIMGSALATAYTTLNLPGAVLGALGVDGGIATQNPMDIATGWAAKHGVQTQRFLKENMSQAQFAQGLRTIPIGTSGKKLTSGEALNAEWWAGAKVEEALGGMTQSDARGRTAAGATAGELRTPLSNYLYDIGLENTNSQHWAVQAAQWGRETPQQQEERYNKMAEDKGWDARKTAENRVMHFKIIEKANELVTPSVARKQMAMLWENESGRNILRGVASSQGLGDAITADDAKRFITSPRNERERIVGQAFAATAMQLNTRTNVKGRTLTPEDESRRVTEISAGIESAVMTSKWNMEATGVDRADTTYEQDMIKYTFEMSNYLKKLASAVGADGRMSVTNTTPKPSNITTPEETNLWTKIIHTGDYTKSRP